MAVLELAAAFAAGGGLTWLIFPRRLRKRAPLILPAEPTWDHTDAAMTEISIYWKAGEGDSIGVTRSRYDWHLSMKRALIAAASVKETTP